MATGVSSISSSQTQRQSGALPYAIVDGRMSFLLITTRRSGKWIFPKGAIEADLSPWDSAAKEALEEAGVVGVVGHEPIGAYKTSGLTSTSPLIDVDIYPLLVTEQFDVWREQTQRLRFWATIEEAEKMLADRDLARLARLWHAKHADQLHGSAKSAAR